MQYNLELEKAVKEIKKHRAKLVCIQLPDGLKPEANKIKDQIEKETKKCPFCNEELHELYFIGDYTKKPPDLDCEVFDDCDNWALVNQCEYEEATFQYNEIGFVNEIISQIAD